MIDTHAHIMFPEFDEDREEVIKRAREAGLEKIVNVGCGAASSELSLKMAREDKTGFLYATLGLHPYDALDLTDELMTQWKKWILEDRQQADTVGASRKIIAIGETGLDYVKSTVEKDMQKKSFRRHLELAVELELPVIVHNRGADEDCLVLMKEFVADGLRAVFHCYGSTLEFAKKVWAAGFLTSFTGIVTYPSAKELREVVKEVPLDRFLLETDCPYLAPQAYRGKRNEPSYVVEVAKKIAEVKGLPFDEVTSMARENTQRFFGF